MIKLDPRIKIAETVLLLAICLTFGWMLWQEHSSDKYARYDLSLTPVGLAAGLTVGRTTGRWRSEALRELAPQLAGKIPFRDKTVLSLSESGRKAVRTEKFAYLLAFLICCVPTFLVAVEFMPAGTFVFFVLGIYLTGQTVPYIRFWLNQQRNVS